MEDYQPRDGHSHNAAWGTLSLIVLALCSGLFGMFVGNQHQFDVIYERVGEIQRELDCPPGETFVTDQDGIEYCLEVNEED